MDPNGAILSCSQRLRSVNSMRIRASSDLASQKLHLVVPGVGREQIMMCSADLYAAFRAL